jgi:hypothetical protein
VLNNMDMYRMYTVYIYIYMLYYIIILHEIYIRLHFHFNLKLPPNKITTQSRFQGHTFELCFWDSPSYEW